MFSLLKKLELINDIGHDVAINQGSQSSNLFKKNPPPDCMEIQYVYMGSW